MRDTLRAYGLLMGLGLRAAPRHAVLQLLTGILFEASLPLGAWAAKTIVNAAVAGDLRRGLTVAILMAVLVGAALSAVFYYVHCLFTVEERAGALASSRLMRLIGGARGLAHFENPGYLDQVQQVQEEQFRLAGMVNATAGLLRVAAALAVTAVLLGQVHPVLLVLPLVAVVSLWLGKLGRDRTVAAQESTAEPERLRKHLFELGTSADTAGELRVYGLTGLMRERHHRVAERVIAERNRAAWQSAGLGAAGGLLHALSYVGAIALVLTLAVHHQATPGDIVLVVGLAALLNATVGTAVMYGTVFWLVLRIGRRLVWLQDYAAAANHGPSTPAEVPAVLRQGIELRDVRFGYPDHDVLAGVSLSLPAGTVVALIGDNGAGKTTLVKLLCGFYRPAGGQILVDGTDLAAFDDADWLARGAATFQDYAKLEFRAGETVGVGDLPRIDDRAAVGAALQGAGGDTIVAELPDAEDTQLGTRWPGGAELSGGQWQRLALARGLMRTDPLIEVFDEPTAALDAHTEFALFERFAEAARHARDRGTVTVLVSHRFSTVRMADLIVVLDQGTIREQGSHAELMAAGGLYAELYELQSRGVPMTVHAMPSAPPATAHRWDPRRIAALRERRGWTQEELAERSGLSVRTIRNLELGVVQNPRRSSVGLLAGALGVPVEETIEGARADGFGAPVPWRGPRPPATEPVGDPAERERLAHAVRASRLTTLVGPGGIGKTRMALHLAAMLGAGFRHGVLVVELGALPPERPSAAEPPAADARSTADARWGAGPASVIAYVRRQLRLAVPTLDDEPELNLMLVLDNAEHVPGGVTAIARELLDEHPRTHILVTSRRRLTERLGANLELAPLATGPAVELVVRHAGAGPLDRDRALVAELCRRLGGLPRHLEFAAERMRTVGVQQLLAYGPATGMLWSHDHALLPHQRSVAASIRWDAGLLGAEHTHMLARLAALPFPSFALADLDQAEGQPGDQALSILSDLYEAALVVADPAGRYRYRLAPFVAEVLGTPSHTAVAS